jgi:hypothetical protein
MVTGSRKRRLAIRITVSVLLLAALASLLLFLSFSGENAVSEDVEGADGDMTEASRSDVASTDTGDEHKVNPGSGTLPELDLEGIIAVSGEFDLNSVPNDVDLDLSANAADYAVIIETIKSVDPNFDPEGYLLRTHILNDATEHGSVSVTLYVQDIETSAHYTVIVDGGRIETVSVRHAQHPAPDKLGQIAQLKSDFEASSAGQREIERVKASLWPNSEGTERYEYSEDYYFDFASDRLYLYVSDNRWVGEYEPRRREPRYGSIDVQKVLGR